MPALPPSIYRYEAGQVGGMMPGIGMMPNDAAAARGVVMAKEAAARGAAMLQQQQQPQYPAAAAPEKVDGITPKIGAAAGGPVLPARRKAEFLRRQQEDQELQQGRQRQRQGEQKEEVAPPPRSPTSQRERDATVRALHNELASTEIHMATLQARRNKLLGRLSEMGETTAPPIPPLVEYQQQQYQY